MSEAVSPPLRKLFAVALLMFVFWLVADLAYATFSARIGIQAQIADLRESYEDLRQRRVDFRSLQEQLVQVTSSSDRIMILADSERAAIVRLQQIARKAVLHVQGKLVSLLDLGGDGRSSVGVQLRAELAETFLTQWLNILEAGEPRVRIDELTIVPRPQSAGSSTQIEVSAILRARWSMEGTTR